MAKIYYTKTLKDKYTQLYKTCEANVSQFRDIDSIVDLIINNRSRYENVADILNIPWYFIAAIHNMESSCNFEKHLHNGDSLSERTKHVPKNRPTKGTAPFSWEESAVDALKLKNLHKVKEWSLPRVLYELEGYNGWGYRLYHHHVLSPYLWSSSNHYISGKYIADGTWSDTAKSNQCGSAVVIKRLEELAEISLFTVDKPLFFYNNQVVPEVDKMQQFLNQFDGIALRVDGWPGKETSSAVKKLFGFYLQDDPRNN